MAALRRLRRRDGDPARDGGEPNKRQADRVDRVCATLKTNQYQVSVENYDVIMAHVTPPMYHGILEIKGSISSSDDD
jgi:hypothetical protein